MVIIMTILLETLVSLGIVATILFVIFGFIWFTYMATVILIEERSWVLTIMFVLIWLSSVGTIAAMFIPK